MKRRHFLSTAVPATLSFSARPAKGAAGAAEFTLPLEKDWRICTDPDNRGRTTRWFDAPLAGAVETKIPAIIQQHFPAYHGVAWYQCEFQGPVHPLRGGRYILRFSAVDYLAEVWLNGAPAGKHEGGETPFAFDVTSLLKPGATNRLTVRVLNPAKEPIDGYTLPEIPHRNKDVPFTPGQSFDTGGITEPVELVMAPAVRADDLFVRADPKTGVVRVWAELRNDTGKALATRWKFRIAAAAGGSTVVAFEHVAKLAPGTNTVEVETILAHPRLWDLADPYLYRLSVTPEGCPVEWSVRFGFRDFRIVDGYFRLNGRRIFLRSTHTGNHAPIGQIIAPREAPDILRRDLLLAKTSGFNTVRFIAGVAHPYQLDLCDEIGLMVYEECYAGWVLKDSPAMAARFDEATLGMVRRDRNHPSVTIWGLLNETDDGPVFRHAVASLPAVRKLDDTRLVLLSSGRWDCQRSIGSASNPGTSDWQHVWGAEAPGAEPASRKWNSMLGGYFEKAGDAHVYPGVPQSAEVNHFFRTVGRDTKPVFLSEYGIGSMMNVIREARRFEQAGANPNLEDFALLRSMAERLTADWTRFGMDGVYPFPEDLLEASQRLMARHRRLGFDHIRSNPKICGFNVTGMLDHGITGEGLWRFWRDWKPGMADALEDGWAPLRWCLFVNPTHAYSGTPLRVEAVLANEDVLPPGEYPARFRICGPEGVAWDFRTTARIPRPASGTDAPLAIPVLDQEVRINGRAGHYELVAELERGGAPFGRRTEFDLSSPGSIPRLSGAALAWGLPTESINWLIAQGITPDAYSNTLAPGRDLILVGDVSESHDDALWADIRRRMEQGATAVFFAPQAFREGKDSTARLPLAKKGRAWNFHDWLYHKECVARRHPAFDGLPAPGILDWYYYGPVIPRYFFDGLDTPDETAAAAFATGYNTLGGYAGGLLLGTYKMGSGRLILNTFKLLEHAGTHPAVDRMLANIVRWAAHR
jgi:hypothetical protein